MSCIKLFKHLKLGSRNLTCDLYELYLKTRRK